MMMDIWDLGGYIYTLHCFSCVGGMVFMLCVLSVLLDSLAIYYTNTCM